MMKFANLARLAFCMSCGSDSNPESFRNYERAIRDSNRIKIKTLHSVFHTYLVVFIYSSTYTRSLPDLYVFCCNIARNVTK